MTNVQGVVSSDTNRDISALLNAHSSNPLALTGLLIAESGLRELAFRDTGGCDVSAGLAQQSMCYLAEKVPGATTTPGQRPSDASINVICDWYWDAAHAIADAGRRFDALLKRAGGDELLACCYWNAPGLDWSHPDPSHAANRENYRRGLAVAEQYAAGMVAPKLVQPVHEQNQFSSANYDQTTAGQAEFRALGGASCSAASLAAVLTAYGQPTNITAALKRIRATGDDVLSNGLQNRHGQGQALADALTAAGIPARTHPWDELTRQQFRDVLGSGRPIVCQMRSYYGEGHFMVVTAADANGVTVADSNTGAGKWTTPRSWASFWAAMNGGVAVFADLIPSTGGGDEVTQAEADAIKAENAALKKERDSLVGAVAYLGDDLADRASALAAEAARVRVQFAGPRPKS